MKTNTLSLLLFGFLTYFAATLRLEAVMPPPDGGYPNLTTAEGTNALFNLTTGAGNTAVGWYALFSTGSADLNTGVGVGALALNNGDSNTATGAAALLFNTTGNSNTAVGSLALEANTGSENTAIGASALANNTTSGSNTAAGAGALLNNVGGNSNTAIGHQALFSNTTADTNTAVGESALYSNTTGTDSTALGFHALYSATGCCNTAVGLNALAVLTTGSGNTALGIGAGGNLHTGSGNINIGDDVSSTAGESNTIRIGDNLPNTPGASFCYIGGIVNQTAPFATAVYIDPNGKLGTVQSSRRYKQDIVPMDSASEVILALKPVTFHYKKELDPRGIPQFGLVAEDVEKISPDLVVRDKQGNINGVRYDQVNAMLLNEFLKEHKTVQEQGAMIARQQKQIEVLTAGLQKVNAQLELSKSAPQTVLNNQ